MDALKEKLELALEEIMRTREQNEFLHKELAGKTSECHQLQLHIDSLEKRIQLSEEMARGNSNAENLAEIAQVEVEQIAHNEGLFDLECLADIAPVVFEEIALNLDRNSIFTLLRTNKFLGSYIQKMLKSTNVVRRINPFRDTTVEIKHNCWKLGANKFTFYDYGHERENALNKDVVRLEKERRASMREEDLCRKCRENATGDEPEYIEESVIEKADLAQRLMMFNPKKFMFGVYFSPFNVEKHLEFLNQIQVIHGVTTEINRSGTDFIMLICEALKPKELILTCPLYAPFEQEYLANKAFETVQHLTIQECYVDAARHPGAQPFFLAPLANNLVTFKFKGSIPAFPYEQVNILLEKWLIGKSPLREIGFQMDYLDDMEHIVEAALENLTNTPVDGITQVPDFLQKGILEDQQELNWSTANWSYRLLGSPSDSRMGSVYYSNYIPPREICWEPKCFYFGFHAVNS